MILGDNFGMADSGSPAARRAARASISPAATVGKPEGVFLKPLQSFWEVHA